MADIYNRIEGDPGFVKDSVEVNDTVIILLQQIEMLLFTRQGEILGAEKAGINIEDLIYTLNANEGSIKNNIVNQIESYCPLARKHTVNVQVNFYKGTERDIGVIDILVDGTTTGIVIT